MLFAIAAGIVLGAFNFALAQNKAADKYPKPDFSAMEEYWEVVEWEYDFTVGVPVFIVTAKPKQKTVPTHWDIAWRDAKGVAVSKGKIMFNSSELIYTKVGEPIRGSSYAPWKREMGQVKTVEVTEREDSPEGRTAN